MKYIVYLFEVVGKESPLYGEGFGVEVLNNEDALYMAWDSACENFPDEELECIGSCSPSMAEAMGYDTY